MTKPYRSPHVQSVAPELIDELLIVAAELAYRRKCSLNVGAGCAVVAGLTLLLRQATPDEVGAWLNWLAAEIEVTGQAPQLRRLPDYRLQLIRPTSRRGLR